MDLSTVQFSLLIHFSSDITSLLRETDPGSLIASIVKFARLCNSPNQDDAHSTDGELIFITCIKNHLVIGIF